MHRTLVVLLVLCASVATATAGERDDDRGHGDGGDDALRQPMVYDAQGKAIGPLEVYSGVNGVYLAIDGEPVFVEVDHKRVGPLQYSDSQYEWVGYTFVPYPSHDCTGSVAVADAGSPTPAMPVREGADVTIYIAGKEESGDVQVWSFKQTDPSTGVTTCMVNPIDEGTNYWPINHTYPLTQHYPEPLRVAY
jgi:hypothetical protein